jgi:hypothetical protein
VGADGQPTVRWPVPAPLSETMSEFGQRNNQTAAQGHTQSFCKRMGSDRYENPPASKCGRIERRCEDDTMCPSKRLAALLMADPVRWRSLGLVASPGLPDCWIGAGLSGMQSGITFIFARLVPLVEISTSSGSTRSGPTRQWTRRWKPSSGRLTQHSTGQ